MIRLFGDVDGSASDLEAKITRIARDRVIRYAERVGQECCEGVAAEAASTFRTSRHHDSKGSHSLSDPSAYDYEVDATDILDVRLTIKVSDNVDADFRKKFGANNSGSAPKPIRPRSARVMAWSPTRDRTKTAFAPRAVRGGAQPTNFFEKGVRRVIARHQR